jgi:peptide/nickel transport system substrate-binding protein
MANGHPMSYKVIFPAEENGPSDRTFEILKSAFAELGIGISQENLDDAAAFNAVTAPNGKELNFDLALWGWSNRPDPGFILSIYQCNQIGNNNDSAYCNPAYDQLYTQQSVAASQSSRQAVVYRLQGMIYAARNYIVLEYPDAISAHHKCWSGFVGTPQGPISVLSKATILAVHGVC